MTASEASHLLHAKLPASFGFDVTDRHGRGGSALVARRRVAVYTLSGPNWWRELIVTTEDFGPASLAAIDAVASRQIELTQ